MRHVKLIATLGGAALDIVVASVSTAVIWLWVDMRNMPAIEHYSPSGWYLALPAGAFAASVLMLIGRSIIGMSRWIGRPAIPRR